MADDSKVTVLRECYGALLVKGFFRRSEGAGLARNACQSRRAEGSTDNPLDVT